MVTVRPSQAAATLVVLGVVLVLWLESAVQSDALPANITVELRAPTSATLNEANGDVQWPWQPQCWLWSKPIESGTQLRCEDYRHTEMRYRVAIPNCRASGVCISNRGHLDGIDVRLSAPPMRAEDEDAVRLAVACGTWDLYWGVRGFPFDPGLPHRIRGSPTGTVSKHVSWPSQRAETTDLAWASPRPQRVIRHGGVSLMMHRHTWVGHFGHNILHNLVTIVDTFDENGLLHLLHRRAASFVALDFAATGDRELPSSLLNLFFGDVMSVSSFLPGEVHCFDRALLGHAHRNMLHMTVYSTPSTSQQSFYARFRRVLEHGFCRGDAKLCRHNRARARQTLCKRPSYPVIGAQYVLPAVLALLVVRCNREQVASSGCQNEDPHGSMGRRTLINEVEILQALHTVSPGTTVKAANPGVLPLAQQVTLMQRTDVLVGASGSALIGMFFLPSDAVVVEMHSFQGTSRPDTTWHELGVSLGLNYNVLQERHWPGRSFSNWDRREAMHIDAKELVDLIRSSLSRACMSGDRSNLVPQMDDSVRSDTKE